MQPTYLLIVEHDVHTKHPVNRSKVTFKGTYSFAPPQPGSSTSNLVDTGKKTQTRLFKWLSQAQTWPVMQLGLEIRRASSLVPLLMVTQSHSPGSPAGFISDILFHFNPGKLRSSFGLFGFGIWVFLYVKNISKISVFLEIEDRSFC